MYRLYVELKLYQFSKHNTVTVFLIAELFSNASFEILNVSLAIIMCCLQHIKLKRKGQRGNQYRTEHISQIQVTYSAWITSTDDIDLKYLKAMKFPLISITLSWRLREFMSSRFSFVRTCNFMNLSKYRSEY
jgi:hypothetical protein